MNISHFTLNTGHVARVVRDDLSEHTIDRLQAIVVDGQGPLPGLDGWYVAISTPLDTRGKPKLGSATFGFADEGGYSKPFAVMGVVCWRPEVAQQAWTEARSKYLAYWQDMVISKEFFEPALESPALSWLSVWWTPFCNNMGAHVARGLNLAARSLAVALIGEGS